jgi:hypothetical protein
MAYRYIVGAYVPPPPLGPKAAAGRDRYERVVARGTLRYVQAVERSQVILARAIFECRNGSLLVVRLSGDPADAGDLLSWLVARFGCRRVLARLKGAALWRVARGLGFRKARGRGGSVLAVLKLK